MKQGRRVTTGVYDDTVKNAIRTAHNLVAVPRLIADWNYNCYTEPVVSHNPSEDTNGFDVEQFPISSLVDSNRPNKGIIKAIVGEAVVSRGYTSAKDAKFYISDRDDNYKYWVSQTTTNSSGTFTNPVRPQVHYPAAMKSNKIVIRIENTWATPSAYQVSIKANPTDTSWTVIGGDNPSIADDGTLTLYYTGSTWTTTRPNTPSTTLANVGAIMFYCIGMGPGKDRRGLTTTYKKRNNNTGAMTTYTTSGANSHLSLIAIEAHMEVDFSSRLLSVSDSFDMGESDQVSPIGKITTNQADISLSNTDQLLNNENPSSQFYGLLDGNVNFNLEYIYTVGGNDYAVQQFNMVSSSWQPGSDDEVNIQLDDISKVLKELKPRKVMYQNKTVWEIMAALLDSVGFSNYTIDESDVSTNFTIPVFWTDGDSTVWEILEELAQASQSAIYVDGWGTVQIKTRDAAFRQISPVWTLRGETSGNELGDVLSVDRETEWEANKVKVAYNSTKWRVGTNPRLPGKAKVWEPDGDVVLRSVVLRSNMNATQDYFVIGADDAKVWPYKGMARIDGEVIEFEGKEYSYIDPNMVRKRVLIKTEDEYKKILEIGNWPEKGYFTGGVKITKRGLWDTQASTHRIDANGYGVLRETIQPNGSSTFSNKAGTGFAHDTRNSLIGLNCTSVADMFIVYTNSQYNTGFQWYGTRLMLGGDKGRTTSRAGISFNMNGTGNDGYYVDVKPSELLTTDERKTRNEVVVYSKKGTTWHIVGKSAPLAIAKGVWYDLDVHYNGGKFYVFIDGRRVISDAATNATTLQPDSGKLGMYAKGRSRPYFEYIYAVGQGGFQTEPLDDFGFLDLKTGGVRSGFYNREIVYKLKTRYKKLPNGTRQASRYLQNVFFFDEFGPYVHEIREFNVDFDPFPVQSSELYMTNEGDAAVLEYNANPTSARFLIANTARHNAVINGEDTINTSDDAPINQVLTVLGRDLDIAEAETIEKKNTLAIKKRGVIESEISSQWIQSKEMAEEIANWIVKHWSLGSEEESVSIVGNPLIEIGDVVALEYSKMNMTASNNLYFVVATSNSFKAGVETELRLRRIRIAPTTQVS